MRRLVKVAFALATLASPLAAQSHPDFSGKWALDPKSVEAGGMPAPTSATMTVVQDTKTVKVDNVVSSQMGEQKTSLTFNLDGTPTKNTISGNGMSVLGLKASGPPAAATHLSTWPKPALYAASASAWRPS